MDKVIFHLKKWSKFTASLFNNLIKSFIFKYGFSKSYLIKVSSVFLLVAVMLSWGISNAINNDIQSATSNFSVSGTVSEVSNTYIVVADANGSLKSSDGSYNLNIDYLKRVETDKYVPLNISDIVVGDKIIAQGVTNGYAFFIKRIVSFTSIAHDVAKTDENATTTATSTAVTADKASSTNASSTSATSTESGGDTKVITPPAKSSVGDNSPSTSTSTPVSDSKDGTSTGSAGMGSSTIPVTPDSTTGTSTDNSSSTSSIVDKVNDVIQTVIDKVKDTVSGVIDKVTGGSSDKIVAPPETPVTPSTPPATPVTPAPAPDTGNPQPVTPATVTE